MEGCLQDGGFRLTLLFFLGGDTMVLSTIMIMVLGSVVAHVIVGRLTDLIEEFKRFNNFLDNLPKDGKGSPYICIKKQG